jgi:hypothetical protein
MQDISGKAIRTRYHGPTATRGPRISASDAGGNLVSISPDLPVTVGELDNAHRKAAYTLMRKMGWPNVLIPGSFAKDTYWVMLPGDHPTTEPMYDLVLGKAVD